MAISSATLSERRPNEELTVNRAMLSVLRDMGDKLTTLKEENYELRQTIDQLNDTIKGIERQDGDAPPVNNSRPSKRNTTGNNDTNENVRILVFILHFWRFKFASVNCILGR